VPVADALEGAVDGAEVVVTMLPDSPDVLAVVDALGDRLKPGMLLIDSSTIDPATAREVADRLGRHGVAVLDAPVSGGEAGAIEGTLSVMVGGEEEAFKRASPILEAVGRTIVHVGPAGAGQVVKAANQLMVAIHLGALAEALVLLGAQDVPLGPALDVLAGGLAGSAVIQRKRGAMLSGEFSPGFRLALHDKDMAIVGRSARAAGLALPLTALAANLVTAAVARGDGQLDHAALYKLLLELNGEGATGKDPHDRH
jgi:2-hydroxy-3-oxopropionate reductase